MTFLHPWAIWIGVAAASVPIVVHLLTRPRPMRMPLSTLRFVREAVRQRLGCAHTSYVRGHDDRIRPREGTSYQVARQYGPRGNVVHRHIEEALNRLDVQIHCEETVGPRHRH